MVRAATFAALAIAAMAASCHSRTAAPPSPAAQKQTLRADCLAAELMGALGREELLVGGMMEDAIARSAPLDIRYLYLAGGTFDGPEPCGSCASACLAGGRSCASSNTEGCAWWGCWQWDREPPGKYLRDFFDKADAQRHLPLVTYYQFLHTSRVPEGIAQIEAMTDAALLTRYLADWRFLLQTVGSRRVLLHIEPDLWGYAQHLGPDPEVLPAAVKAANPRDCAKLPDTVAGFGRCMIQMARTYAPNAKVGLHASFWATKIDVSLNKDPALDVAGEARKVGVYLQKLGGADADFVVIGASDRDAAWYATKGQRRWWDETNATLPNFDQAFAWARTVSETLKRPHLWWQLPLGNRQLPNENERWQDNRVDYFFGNPEQIVHAHGFGMVFGAGMKGMTTPSTDGGNFVEQLRRYRTSVRPKVCR